MGKKKQHKQHSAKHRSDAELIQTAERASAHAKWKDALNAYKELNKRHPGQYDAALTQVQAQRYQTFLKNEMFESADQLLANLRDQLPPEQLQAFELQRAISHQDQGTITTLYWQSLEQMMQANQPLAPALLESLIFNDAPPTPALIAHPEIETLLAVRAGLIALCSNQPEQFTAATAKISRQSPLAHWKLVLRALNAWYTQQDDILDKCLIKLTNLPERASRIVTALRLLRQTETPTAAESLTDAFALHDISESSADLMRTDTDLNNYKVVAAFKFATSKFRFSSTAESPIQQFVIDRFVETFQQGNNQPFNNYIHQQLETAHARQPAWFPFMRATFSNMEASLPCACSDCISEFGRTYLQILTARRESPALLARAYFYFADILLKDIAKFGFDPSDQALTGYSVELLQQAMQLDPHYPEPGKMLVAYYFEIGRKSAGNKLLDHLAATIPNNPEILLLAGANCTQRGTLARAVKQLEKALAIDPHLPQLKSRYIEALLKQSIRYYQQKQLKKGRNCFEKMQPHLLENSDHYDYFCNAQLIRLHRLELEFSYGPTQCIRPSDASDQITLPLEDDDYAEIVQLNEAIAADWKKRPLLREALSYLFIELHGTPQRIAENSKKRDAFFNNKTLAKRLSIEQAIVLQKAIEETTARFNKTLNWAQCFEKLAHAHLKHYAPERLEGILKLTWLLLPKLSPEEILDTCKRWSKADRHHPQLKMLAIVAKIYRNPNLVDECQNELESALDVARERNDTVALTNSNKVRKLLDSLTKNDNPNCYDFEDDIDDDMEDVEKINYKSLEEHIDLIYAGWKRLNAADRKKFEASMQDEFGKKMSNSIIRTFKQKASAE